MKDLLSLGLFEAINKGIEMLRDPNTEIQISKMERAFLIKHKDSFQYTLNNQEGFVKLSQWWVCWSVKWYSIDNGRQVVLVDGVTETEAQNYFDKLKEKINQ